MPEPILAIDFGTSTSAAILVTGAGEELVGERSGAGLTWPSAVCFDGAGLFVGTEAENRKRRFARQYRAEFKLELGREEAIDLGGQSFPVPALITALVAEMKKTAEQAAGEPVTRTVLTIPASYGEHDRRRALMIDAAADAGFDVVELLPEPVAAALAPVAGPPFPEGSLILVYDLGGGTFDTALVRVGRRDNEVLAHAAIDHGSGGRDIDGALYGELLNAGGTPLADLVKADRARLELVTRTEELKRRLTKTVSAEDSIGDEDILLAATRDKLEELAAPLIQRTIECVRAMLAGTSTAVDDLTEVLLVGGAAQMPIVETAVTAELGRPIRTARAPQLAVVQGAARFAGAAATRFVRPQPRRVAEIPLRWQIPGKSATLLRWRAPVDDDFAAGQPLADVRLTSGAIWELRADRPGRLRSRHAAEGATVMSGDWLVTSVSAAREPAPTELFHVTLTKDVNCVTFSPDGNSFVSGDDSGRAIIFDIRTQRAARVLRHGDDGDYVRAVAYSPDGTRLASAGDGEVRLWQVSNGSQLTHTSCGNSDAWGISFHPDGRRLAIPGSEVQVWDSADGSTAIIATESSKAARFAPDGTKLASAHDDGKARVWDMPSGDLAFDLDHPGKVNWVAFSPDGGRIATGSNNGFAAVWDAQTGELVRSLDHGAHVQAIEFSPDGALVATAGSNECRLWDAEDGGQLASVRHESVYGLAFSPDGERFATAGWSDDMVRVWSLY